MPYHLYATTAARARWRGDVTIYNTVATSPPPGRRTRRRAGGGDHHRPHRAGAGCVATDATCRAAWAAVRGGTTTISRAPVSPFPAFPFRVTWRPATNSDNAWMTGLSLISRRQFHMNNTGAPKLLQDRRRRLASTAPVEPGRTGGRDWPRRGMAPRHGVRAAGVDATSHARYLANRPLSTFPYVPQFRPLPSTPTPLPLFAGFCLMALDSLQPTCCSRAGGTACTGICRSLLCYTWWWGAMWRARTGACLPSKNTPSGRHCYNTTTR